MYKNSHINDFEGKGIKEEKNIPIESSRKVVIRDIKVFAPISRIPTLRDDEGLSGSVGQVQPDNKGMPANLNAPRTPMLTHSTLSLKGEGENKDTPSPWRGRVYPVRSEYGVHEVGMRGKNAFTLIELLVVVLVIAILAAIALPQYQMTVLKSRIAKASVILNAMEMSQNAYRLEHGYYARSQKDLDIKSSMVSGYGSNFAPYGTIKINDSITLQWVWRQAPPWDHNCVASSPFAHRVCQSLGGQPYNNRSDTETRTYYRLP